MNSLAPRTMAASRSAVRAPAFAAVRRQFHSTPSRFEVYTASTEESFKSQIKDHDKVIVDCFATWCGPCKAIAPILLKASETKELENVRFLKFDVDELPELSQNLGVRAMPTFFFFHKGEKVDELVGANPPTLMAKLKALADR